MLGWCSCSVHVHAEKDVTQGSYTVSVAWEETMWFHSCLVSFSLILGQFTALPFDINHGGRHWNFYQVNGWQKKLEKWVTFPTKTQVFFTYGSVRSEFSWNTWNIMYSTCMLFLPLCGTQKHKRSEPCTLWHIMSCSASFIAEAQQKPKLKLQLLFPPHRATFSKIISMKFCRRPIHEKFVL